MNASSDEVLEVKITLLVKQFGVNVYAGPSMKPQPSFRLIPVGILTLEGDSSPPGYKFKVNVYPDGTDIPAPFVREGNVVDMSISHSQMGRIMEILRHADAAHALYRIDSGDKHADVHGEFSRNKPPI